LKSIVNSIKAFFQRLIQLIIILIER